MKQENKINIAELLKDYPEGMELDSTLFDDIYFDCIDDVCDIIKCYIQESKHKIGISFDKYGHYSNISKSKCVIFPKGKTTWEGFVPPCQFKDGDIVYVKTKGHNQNEFIIIFQGIRNDHIQKYVCFAYQMLSTCKAAVCHLVDVEFMRLATEEEKQKLLDAIKANGYKWNAETKTLEKLTVSSTPEKFYIRIGDIPSEEKSSVYKGDVVVGYEEGVSVYDCVETDGLYRIVMPFPLKEGQGNTYECLIQEITQCRFKIEKPRNVYLVSGIEVGKGHDNEPLIKDVKILKDLTEQFNTKNDNTEENNTLEKLIEPKFKVDDKIKLKGGDEFGIITEVADCFYTIKCKNNTHCWPIKKQDDWELVPNKFDITTLKPFDNCKFSLDGGITWKYAQYWFIQEKYNTKDIDIELWQG